MAYGGSVSQLASLQAAEESQKMQLRQQALMTLAGDLANEQRRREALNFQMREADRDAGMRQSYFGLAERNAKNQADHAASMLRLQSEDLEWRRGEPSRVKVATEAQANRDYFKAAQQEADMGTFDPKAYEGLLTPQQAVALVSRRDVVRKEAELGQAYFKGIADVLNKKPEAYDAMISAEKQASWNPANNGLWNTADKSAIEEWQAARNKIGAEQVRARAAMGAKNFPVGRVYEDDGTYRVQPLPWQTNGTATNAAKDYFGGTSTGTVVASAPSGQYPTNNPAGFSVTPAVPVAPPPAETIQSRTNFTPIAQQMAASIKAQFRAGKINQAEAEQQLRAIGFQP